MLRRALALKQRESFPGLYGSLGSDGRDCPLLPGVAAWEAGGRNTPWDMQYTADPLPGPAWESTFAVLSSPVAPLTRWSGLSEHRGSCPAVKTTAKNLHFSQWITSS